MSSSSIVSSSRAPISMRSAGPSFHSDSTGSGGTSPVRTVASTVAGWVRAICCTKMADPFPGDARRRRRRAAAAPGSLRRSPERSAPISTRGPPATCPHLMRSGARHDANAPNGNPCAALVALARRWIIPRCSADSTALRAPAVVLPTPAGPVITRPAWPRRLGQLGTLLARPTIRHPATTEGNLDDAATSGTGPGPGLRPALLCLFTDCRGPHPLIGPRSWSIRRRRGRVINSKPEIW